LENENYLLKKLEEENKNKIKNYEDLKKNLLDDLQKKK
jgi:hypothetical protein